MKRFLMGIFFLFGLFIGNIVYAATVQLTWDAPSAYQDGTPLLLSSITAYNIYYGISPTTMTTKLTLPITTSWPSLASMNYTLNNINAGTWYFAITCSVGTSESSFSNIVSKTIVLVPNPPSNLIILGGVTYVP